MPNYHLTLAQIDKLLTSAIEMFVEYCDKHGRDEETAKYLEETAKYLAVAEMIGGLEADRELAANDPSERLRLQLPNN